MRKYSFIFAAVLALAACRQVQPQAFSVIPMPAEVSVSEGAYSVAGKAFFLDPRLDNASQDAIWRFKDALEAPPSSMPSTSPPRVSTWKHRP